MAENNGTIVLACPVPDCGYKPPANMREQSQRKALERHIALSHDISQLPAVVDAMEEAKATVGQQPATEQPSEAPQPPAPEQPQQEQPQQPREAISVAARPARTDDKGKAKSLAPVLPIDPKKERINERANRWGKQLYEDFNPVLVQGAQAIAGLPEEWMDLGSSEDKPPIQLQTADGKILTFWQPSIRAQLTLSQRDCNRLAQAGAQFAESPLGQAATAWLEHNSHFIALGAALYTAGMYGWKLMKIRTEVGQLTQIIQQQQQMAQPGPASNPAADAA